MTSHSTLRLSEVARHVVIPSGIVTTGWPAVEGKLADLGITFDGWQQGASRIILGKRADGLYAAAVGGVAMSIPRQVGKTFMVGALVFALCLLFPGMTVLWTAHRTRTASETFRSMQGLAKRRRIAPFIEIVRRGSGEQAVEFTNGSRILFGAREDGFGRGFDKVDVVIFDEAQILGEKALDDMLPATNQGSHPAGALVFFIGTPPRPTDDGEVFTRIRTDCLSGDDRDTIYLEFSADPECDPDGWPAGYIDWDQVARANPSYPTRTSRTAILRMVKRLGRASIRREALGLWDSGKALPSLIGAPAWRSLVGVSGAGETAFGVKFSNDAAALAVAVFDGSTVHVEGIEERPMSEGTGWLVDWLATPPAPGLEPAWRSASAIVVDGREGAGMLASALDKAGVRRVTQPTVEQVITAHAEFLEAVRTKTLTHPDQAGMNAAVARATKRKIGTAGGWGWQSLDGESVLILEAATLAAHGARHHKRPAGRGSRRRGFSG